MDRRIVALKSKNPLYTVLIFHEFTFIHTLFMNHISTIITTPAFVCEDRGYLFKKKRSEELHSIFVKLVKIFTFVCEDRGDISQKQKNGGMK